MKVSFDKVGVDLEEIDYETLGKLTNELEDEDAQSVKLFYDGDHWQGAKGWVAPMPADNSPDFKDTMEEIENVFVSINTVAECSDRHRDAVIGSEPDWGFVRAVDPPLVRNPETQELEEAPLSEQEELLVAEAGSGFAAWSERVDLLSVIQEVVKNALTQRRGVVRLFIPPDELEATDSGGNVPTGSLAESLARIHIDAPDISDSGVFEDARTGLRLGVYAFTDDEGNKGFEVSRIDATGQTSLTIVTKEGEEDSKPIDLARNLTMFEVEMKKPLITKQFISQQKFRNMNATMWLRNSAFAGFRERWLINAEPPGEEKEDPATGKKRFFPGVFNIGGKSANILYGVSGGINVNTGGETVTTPDVKMFEPVAVATFTETDEGIYSLMLSEVKQPHVKLNESATPSGKARIEARADFRESLRPTEGLVKRLYKYVGETVLHMAAAFSNSATRYKGLRLSVSPKINLGALSVDEIEAGLKLVEKFVWSLEYFQSLTGVQDTDAMNKRIKEENPMRDIQVEQAQVTLEGERLFNKNAAANKDPENTDPSPAPAPKTASA